jgi:hypothetical protein
MNSTSKTPSLVVYTVLLGQKAELNTPPVSPNTDFVCLTDQKDLIANGWEIKSIEPMFPDDIPRSSRHPKINAHLYFNDYSRSIYIDSSVQLLTDPEPFWSELVQSEEVVFGGIAHSFHVNMLEELEAVSANGFETNDVIQTQLEFTLGTFKGYLSARPIWGGILARRHNESDCRNAMELWFSLILQHSRRDQLSLPLALRGLRGHQIQVSYLNNLDSKFYKWPVGGYVRPSNYSYSRSQNLEIKTLHLNQIDRLSINSVTAQHHLQRANFERDAITAERDAITAERDAITAERDAIINTKVWRWTKGLRNLVFRLRTLFDS